MPTPDRASAGSSDLPVLAVGAIVTLDEHLLLVSRANPPAQGLWSVPGGRVEPGETMSEAVAREVAEETGLAVTCDQLVGWVERMGPGFHFVIFDFRATLVGGAGGGASTISTDAVVPTAGDDADDARWVRFSDLSSMELVPGLLEFLDEHDVIDRLDRPA